MDESMVANSNSWTQSRFIHWIYNQVNMTNDVDNFIKNLENSEGAIRNNDCFINSEFKEVESTLNSLNYLYSVNPVNNNSYNNLFLNMMNTWQSKSPENWNNEDILDWIYFTAGLNNIQLSDLRGENFQGLNGKEFCRMSSDDFKKRDREYGEFLYLSFFSLYNQRSDSVAANRLSELSHQRANTSQFPYLDLVSFQSNIVSDSVTNQPSLTSDAEQKEQWPVDVTCGNLIPATVQMSEMQDFFGEDDLEIKQEIKQKTTSSSSSNKKKRRKYGHEASEDSNHFEVRHDLQDMGKRKHSSKILLSNFMRDLLDNSDYNPSCVRWEDKEKGIFRIISGKSKYVAELWGRIKNNPKMTFEKMGRSLRWCRANNGNFSSIPKDENLPKKLCFRLSS